MQLESGGSKLEDEESDAFFKLKDDDDCDDEYNIMLDICGPPY